MKRIILSNYEHTICVDKCDLSKGVVVHSEGMNVGFVISTDKGEVYIQWQDNGVSRLRRNLLDLMQDYPECSFYQL